MPQFFTSASAIPGLVTTSADIAARALQARTANAAAFRSKVTPTLTSGAVLGPRPGPLHFGADGMGQPAPVAMVYVNGGRAKAYHRLKCGRILKDVKACRLEDARAKKLRPCRWCHPVAVEAEAEQVQK